MTLDSVTTQSGELELLSKLVNISGNSLKIKKLVVKEPEKAYELRPQLHTFISAPFGEFKSELLDQVADHYESKKLDDISFASLVGSIDKTTKQIIPAAAWEARNKLLLLDEFTATRPSKFSNALLQLMEDQRYSRKIATYSANGIEKDKDLFFKAEDGNITLRTRFAAIVATMKNVRKSREYMFKALLSRCIPIRYELSLEEINQVLDGKPIFAKENYDPEEGVRIDTSDYQHIREVLEEEIKNRKLNRVEEIYARTVGECCRIYAVLGKHDEELYKDVLKLKSEFA